jgi:hypothetical protein
MPERSCAVAGAWVRMQVRVLRAVRVLQAGDLELETARDVVETLTYRSNALRTTDTRGAGTAASSTGIQVPPPPPPPEVVAARARTVGPTMPTREDVIRATAMAAGGTLGGPRPRSRIALIHPQRDRQRDRQTDRHTDRETERQRDRQTDRHTDRQTERHTHIDARTPTQTQYRQSPS